MIVCVSISEEAMVIVEGSLEAILGDQVVTLEVWPESHWPGFALREADVFKTYMAWWCM